MMEGLYGFALGEFGMVAILLALLCGWLIATVFGSSLQDAGSWIGRRTGLFILGSPVKRVELFATQARPIAEPDGIDGAELDGPDPARCTFAVMRDEVVYGCRRRAEHQGLHANGNLRWGADKLVAIWDRNIFKQLLGALRAYLRKSVR